MAIKFGRPLEASRLAPVSPLLPPRERESGEGAPVDRLDLAVRPRRNRRAEWVAAHGARERAHHRRPDLAAVRGRRRQKSAAPVASMPGVERLSVDRGGARGRARGEAHASPASRCFPTPTRRCATTTGSEALNPDNLVCRAIRAIKKEVPEIGVLCDVALDPYTSHGHDGLLMRRRHPQRRDRRGAGPAGAGPGRGRLRHHRAVRHDGRPRRRHPRGARRRPVSATCRSWPMRPNTPRPSTARSATRSARRQR